MKELIDQVWNASASAVLSVAGTFAVIYTVVSLVVFGIIFYLFIKLWNSINND